MLLASYADSMTTVGTSAGAAVKVTAGASSRSAGDDPALLTATVAPGESLMFSVEVPLGDAEGFWHPSLGHVRTLPADWSGRQRISLVSSAPVGVLYDKAGTALLGFACDETVDEITMRYGVCEETRTFVVHLEIAPDVAGRTATLAITTTARPWTDTLAAVRDWLGSATAIDPMPAGPTALEPVYSTWYTFTQAITAELVEQEAAAAASIGCAAVFLDDGWQRFGEGRGYAGCGDWVPDPVKFPDLTGHVQRLHDLGLSAVLWIAPLLVGRLAESYQRLAPLAPHFAAGLDTHILDPRRPDARDHVVATCVRLMRDHRLDGLKIDFLDTAGVYQGTPGEGDVTDVGLAMQLLLRQLRDALAAAGHSSPMLEFRQPYVSPSLAPYGNILRAGDCPADTVVNRRSIVDCRLLSFGRVIHSDMLMWDPLAPPTAAARQLLNVFFSVPQISMRLTQLPASHLAALRHLLRRWRSLRGLVLDNDPVVGLPSDQYPVIQSWGPDGEGVVGVYGPQCVRLDLTGKRRVTVLNGTAESYVVVDLIGAPATTARVSRCGPDGSDEVSAEVQLRAGVQRLDVPPCGLLTISLG